MTDNEIIKALECCCAKENCEVVSCERCPLEKHYECTDIMFHETVDFINRQKAEILELQKRIINWRADMDYRPDEIKSEAIKEFAEKLKNCFAISGDYLDIINIIDNLVKEMTEENENDRA